MQRLRSKQRCLGAVLTALTVAGCTGSAASPSAQLTKLPIIQSASAASPNSTATPTPSLSPTTRTQPAFVPTGSMTVARGDSAATLLKDGKVLLAGGNGGFGPAAVDATYASAELYDPATGRFSSTGSMTAARSGAAAVLLADGRVLVAGGQGCADPRHCSGANNVSSNYLSSAELYDSTTGVFTKTGSMAEDRIWATATLLPDARVLIAGGNWDGRAELYDPSTGRFSRTGNGGAVGRVTVATLVPDGKVLVIGEGSDEGSTFAQLYNEATGSFRTISLALPASAPLATYDDQVVARANPTTATLLKDGRVLLFDGGYLELYDPATGACTDAGFVSPGGQWDGAAAIPLPDGRVLFEGGLLEDPAAGTTPMSASAVVYDPTAGPLGEAWSRVARSEPQTINWPDGRTDTLLSDGSVLVAGGEDANSIPLASAELFKP